jgi:hypothetical protein
MLVDMYGPHTAHVEALLAALADPAIRRRRLGTRSRTPLVHGSNHRTDHAVYVRVCAAGRLDEWDTARMAAAKQAVPSQRDDAAGAAMAVVASDLINDELWRAYTDTRLWAAVGLERPDGGFSERCGCGHQLGERLAAATIAQENHRYGEPPTCRCVTPSLPTAAAVEAAFGLVRNWTLTWDDLIQFSARIGQHR